MADPRIAQLASELVDAAVLDVEGSTGESADLRGELADLRAAEAKAVAAVVKVIGRYRTAAISRATSDER